MLPLQLSLQQFQQEETKLDIEYIMEFPLNFFREAIIICSKYNQLV